MPEPVPAQVVPDPRAASGPKPAPASATTIVPLYTRPRPHAHEARARTAVGITLALVIGGLFLALSAMPGPRPSRETIEAERLCVELRLTLAEMRATIAEHRIAHGSFPGAAPSSDPDPAWLDRQIELAFRRPKPSLRHATDGGAIRNPNLEGPVLRNPLNQLKSVRFLSASEPWPADGDDTTGWLYRPATGEIHANSPGTSPWSGNRFFEM